MAKRIFDLVFTIPGIVVLAPVFVIIAILIKYDSSGAVFFRQERVGRYGKIFRIYKFRTMIENAERRGKQITVGRDARITAVGDFLRKYKLDELPQLFNVLLGDMSLVGTRPPTLDEFVHYKSYHKRRLSAKPGITGLWQVSGRNDIEDFEDVVKLDLEYIDNWSLGLDVKILLKTVGAVFKHTGK